MQKMVVTMMSTTEMGTHIMRMTIQEARKVIILRTTILEEAGDRITKKIVMLQEVEEVGDGGGEVAEISPKLMANNAGFLLTALSMSVIERLCQMIYIYHNA